MSIVVVGSINTDITSYGEVLPRIGETVMGKSYAMELGGKGANQAAAAARLGAKVEFVGQVGADAFGELALERLAQFGVSTRYLTKDPEVATGIAIIGVDAQGQNAITIIPGANMRLGEKALLRALPAFERAKVLMLQLEIPASICLAAARAARERGVIVVLDPAPAPVVRLPDELYPLIDVVTPNETEAEVLLGFRPRTLDEAGRAARGLIARGARAALVTLGSRGAFLARSEPGTTQVSEALIASFPVMPVSTVAAGDCFNAGLAVALGEGRDLMEAARFASACGALCVTKPGSAASAPTREEVEELLASS
ncbi:MAG: ribokinase [Hyphomicrobiales bacterium]|nr:ribokinase [Hyphomicrobiales bacterium]